MHRIQNVVIPSRAPRNTTPRRRAHSLPYGYTHFIQNTYSSFLPLDFGRTHTRLALHLPTLYFLGKMLVLWSVLVLQSSGFFPDGSGLVSAGGWTGSAAEWIAKSTMDLGKWGTEKEMSEICWMTFCAVCAAFCLEGFVRALDGLGGGFTFGGHMNPNTSPFNLVGQTFQLHLALELDQALIFVL